MKRQKLFSHRCGFTLVEVVLAISIAVGILVVALYFYQQAAALRTQLIDESGKLASVRLLMERISSDLRSAQSQPQVEFEGSSSGMKFVSALIRPADLSSGILASNAPAAGDTDLRVVNYGVAMESMGTNRSVRGITRTESLMLDGGGTRERTATRPLSFTGAELALPDPSTRTNLMTEPLSELIRYVHYAYWDGSAWSENWHSQRLPMAVEVTLGLEPQTESTYVEDSGADYFRRTITLPTAGARAPSLSQEDRVVPSVVAGRSPLVPISTQEGR